MSGNLTMTRPYFCVRVQSVLLSQNNCIQTVLSNVGYQFSQEHKKSRINNYLQGFIFLKFKQDINRIHKKDFLDNRIVNKRLVLMGIVSSSL